MRRALAPLTNVLGRIRSRSSSPSSSDSELDDDDDELQPVGDRIGHDVRFRHPSYLERNDFTYVRNMPDGTERTYEDIAVEQIRAAGLNPNELVLRKNFYNTKTRCERFKFVCADVRVCGCPYYIYVNFGRRGKGSIEECVNNRHNDHIPLARRTKIRATVRQKVVLDACVRDGVMPLGIMRRLEAEGLDQGLTLRYVQRYKANHKTAALGQAGFMGTVKEYEDLFNAWPVEDTASDDTAGVVYWEINTPQNQPAQVRVIVSSKRLLKRLSTEIVPGILGWCVDGTYKLNRERHVTVPIGVFDMHRKFYLCAFAIVPGPGENEDDFEWIATQLEKYLEPPGRETRHSRSIIQLISDSSAGLVSGLTKGFTNRQLESNRCWFHTKGDWKEQIPKKVHDQDNDATILEELRALHEIPYPLVDFYNIAFDAWERRWREREPDVVQYIHANWRQKRWSFCYSIPGFPTTNNGVESKNAKIKQAFRREKMHLRESTRLLAELIETEVKHFTPDFDTSYPEMNRHDYIETDKFIRNHLDKDQALRIELNSELSFYPRREFLDEIKHFISLQDVSDDRRAEQRMRIIRARATLFHTFYERTMVGGRPPAVDEATYKFKNLMSLARAFHVVTKLPPHECSDTVLYRCTCVATDKSKPHSCSYGKHRKCKHVFAEGIRRNTLQRQRGFILVHQRVTPGRPTRMPPALVRERPAAVVNQYAAWGLDVPEDA